MTTKMIDKLALITLKDGKVAMVHSHNKTLFYAPGGKREAGETDEQALCREIDEELTVTLIPDSISFYGDFTGQADGKQDGTQVRIRCFQAEFTGELKPAAEIAELAWLDSRDLPRCSLVAALIIKDLSARKLIN
ncbi:NUDIX domain-containing protein [Morganella psychrotolerans]|uniref:8-oxo-dGTP diphosphatase n=1 Tax=Morganella psychrotolerans TaxID=368603 RepID=A0A5M9R951_9GAMM|nr:NUDIX domain-containing protein [Morganella psychrotolerans]KAA8717270.1 NUDIX domain-containing protein [Morganella psychrotolerans]OBU08442.1 NUDIX hydrolase [Morganella psychrotolerans]